MLRDETEIPRIFSFDAEPEGLYGPPFAIGAVVLDEEGSWLAWFGGWVEPQVGTEHPWVRERYQAVTTLHRYDSYQELLDAFWRFWMTHREECVCVSDWGSPVESGLMRRCVEVNPEERQFLGPTPLHEVSTALLCAGLNPDIDRIEMSGLAGRAIKHNPRDDAWASGLCFRIALKACAAK